MEVINTYTKRLSKYIKDKGISFRKIAEATGMPYTAVYDSLGDNERSRPLRIDEYIAICKFLEKDPMDFVNEEPKEDESA